MTIPEYDKECDCEFCTSERKERTALDDRDKLIRKDEREKVLGELISVDMFIARHVGGKYIEIGEIRQFIHNRIKELRGEG